MLGLTALTVFCLSVTSALVSALPATCQLRFPTSSVASPQSLFSPLEGSQRLRPAHGLYHESAASTPRPLENIQVHHPPLVPLKGSARRCTVTLIAHDFAFSYCALVVDSAP